jgi:hypothetical protein
MPNKSQKGNQVNKVYQKYLPEYLSTKKYVYIKTADLASLVLDACKKTFPQYTFAKSSTRFSGGSSVDIYLQTGWETISGEDRKEINRFVDQYNGVGFDGMVDYKFYKNIWISPDGLAEQASSEGSVCTGGCYEKYSYQPTNPNSICISSGSWVSFEPSPKYGTKPCQAYTEYCKKKNNQQQEAA